MDKEAIQNVKTSYGRCLVNGDVFQEFYDHFLKSDPRLAPMFKNTDFAKQKELLRHGLNLALMYAGGNSVGKSGLAKIRKSHSRQQLNIPPSMYSLWVDSFLATVEKMDDKLDQKVFNEWREALNIAVDYIKEGYEEV